MPEVVSTEAQDLGIGHVWVFGSKTTPGLIHVTVQVEEKDDWICTCPGYVYRAHCRHISELREAAGYNEEPDEDFHVIL